MKEPLNFKVGQTCELKSFITGFRGAWFRFKIIDILLKQNKIKLEYLDYDDGSAQSHSTPLVMGLLQLHDGRTAGTDSEREEANDAEQVGDSPLDAYGTGTSNDTRISLDSLVEGETEMQSSEAMDVAVCEDVKMDDLESIDSISIIGVQESNAAAAAFEKGTR
ncbi:agenet domain-containing protein [Tanacetum coccineum]